MNAGPAVAVAVAFCWLGMVLAISFIEAPLKFRAPGVTLQIGLGIGRRVFRALNAVETVFAVVIIGAFAVHRPTTAVITAFAIAVAALAVQLIAVRPKLIQRSNAVLAVAPGEEAQSRSQAHYYYVGFELIKVIALLTGGVLLLAG
ncbi:MAG: hypothetical protein WBB05_07830 [Mycolicibacterium fortuitum]|uniref:hypothetical protein n=1 Tax=Mycolicibacterium TaxID=1866885 RepID=UPI0007E9EA4A|nr:hypothetical protein [Mycolicibacterium fortuitum]OBA93447.1 hypothetical protein A5665_09750 [Mycolicibacterium fortuitum]OBI63701.1 hypothetical protein A5667_04885 [Mycolicibacterium fortuitum]OBI66522.1 hypothetical protein A5666_04545 [Mycolicibacterium fortuitum]OMC02769.1 hypothetical protein A5734_13755 [Mycolicibacterium fortuitum]UBV17923.1 hypothetical protein H8Z57_14685 [Mycolicibacterium fortuitum]